MQRRLIISAILAFSQQLSAEVMVDPVEGSTDRGVVFGGVFTMSEVDYETDGDNLEAERRILGMEVSKKISPKWSVVGQIGFGLDIEYENDFDGNGFNFGGGGRGIVYESGPQSVSILGLLSYINESVDREISGNKVELDTSLLEMHLAGIYNHKVDQTIEAYVGLEIVPLSDGEIDADGGGDGDIERDDLFNLRGGARIYFNDLVFRAELALIGEQTFNLALAGFF